VENLMVAFSPVCGEHGDGQRIAARGADPATDDLPATASSRTPARRPTPC